MRQPLFCPNAECSEHWHSTPPSELWWTRDGWYRSNRSGRVQRYRCKRCGTRFSSSSFSPHYYAKKRINLYTLKRLITNGSSVRATARHLNVSPTTVTQRCVLLCRQSLAAHAELSEGLAAREPLVADGFQSYWVSQFHPNNFNLLAGAESQYLFAMTQATLRRGGSMTSFQKRKRARIEAADPSDSGALTASFQELLEAAQLLWSRMDCGQRVLRTDRHQSYPPCVSRCTVPHITHLRISSRKPRTLDNPLFAVNYLDREIRKDLAEHHRESVCFARSAALSTARLWIYLVSHNIEKPYRISPKHELTHAEVAGISGERLRRVRRRLLSRRAFFSRAPLDHMLRRVWMGMIPSPERENRINMRLTPGYCAA